jgi:hypothetical protein
MHKGEFGALEVIWDGTRSLEEWRWCTLKCLNLVSVKL